MLFNSLTFFYFLALFLPVYFFTRGRARIMVSLAGSYLFYGWWDWRFLGLILFSTLLDYHLGKQIYAEESPLRRKRLLWLTMSVNLGLLGVFKYFNFFIDSFGEILRFMGMQPHLPTLSVILPVGISFYTFQTMSYTIDIYRRHLEPEYDFFKFATFVAFFPQLVAGPIVRASDFLPQFNRPDTGLKWDRFISGMSQVILGFFKKVAVADSLAVIIDRVYGSPLDHSSLMLIVTGVLYSFQIYCDFSGYSDIAIGLARILGFDFPENFRSPYFSKNFSEFWRRWHISLSTWLRDYLYISLGGNRGGSLFTYRNLMLTMLLGGLWHGANWTFIVWGGLHGLYLVVQRLLDPWFKPLRESRFLPLRVGFQGFAILFVFALTTLTWTWFRLPSIGEANAVVAKMLSFQDLSPGSLKYMFNLGKGGLLIAILLIIDIMYTRVNLNNYFVKRPILAVPAFCVIIWIIALFGTFGNQQFIYFQF